MALRDGVNAHLGDEVEVGVPVLNLRANDEHACVDTKCRGQAENEYNGYSREGDRDSVCMCECVSVCVGGGRKKGAHSQQHRGTCKQSLFTQHSLLQSAGTRSSAVMGVRDGGLWLSPFTAPVVAAAANAVCCADADVSSTCMAWLMAVVFCSGVGAEVMARTDCGAKQPARCTDARI